LIPETAFMAIFLVGINHKTAPVEVRERLAFSDEACGAALRSLVDGATLREGLIVSTCNRVEIIGAADEKTPHLDGTKRISDFLMMTRRVPRDVFSSHFYAHTEDAAVRHVFRVASSLDSMVVGETQILGQVRRAYSLAVEAGTAGRVLHRLMHHAMRVAKRVRTETGIASSAVSISYTAVELGRKIFGALEGATVLLVGAGEMAELAAQHLKRAGAAKLLIANRTRHTAEELAQKFDAHAIEFDALGDELHNADIVICSTAAENYVITPAMAEAARAARRNRPAFLIDISVPRNIDPEVGAIDNIFVFDVDDLEAVVASNIREREREAQRAELIIDAEVMNFQRALRSLDAGPAIGAMRERFQQIAREEFARQRNRLGNLTPEQERAIENLLRSTVNKISHPVIQRLRRAYATNDLEDVQSWREDFKLEDET
jgi:glutamyl-tRNA reductase